MISIVGVCRVALGLRARQMQRRRLLPLGVCILPCRTRCHRRSSTHQAVILLGGETASMKSIVIVGSLNLDLVATVSRMPAEGETLTGKDFATFPGGKGANQAVAAARLGAKVTMVGRLGTDAFADQLRKALVDAKVDASCVVNVDRPTGSAVILVTERGSNSIVVVPGANHLLLPEDMDLYRDVFRGASVILAQLEIPIETVERLGELAAELGVPFMLDPAPAQALSVGLLGCVTWLTPNESETRTILGHLGYSSEDGGFEEEAVAAVAQRLLATGVRNVILKLGSRGVYLAGADVAATRVEPYIVHAVDTTAAGDAFNGGFAYGLTEGMEPIDAARFASAVAAVSVTRSGAQPSLPRLEEVYALIGTTASQTKGA
jgi:ribokinase